MSINISMRDYPKLLDGLLKCSEEKRKARLRNLARHDLYFLIRFLLNRADIDHPWLFARCREVQEAPNGYIDLWAREHYKSTIITWGKTIQDILATHGDNPVMDTEYCMGIFSHTRPIAKKFLRQIKQEFENNRILKDLFPDILYQDPAKESPLWSLDSGIIVKRKGNPKEATVEAWGLVDSQPTSAHFNALIYDDVVTRDSVTTPEMISKTTEAWELSQNLGSRGGIQRVIGTRYHYNDTYRTMMDRGTFKPRIHPATENGEVDGDPVFLSKDELVKKRRDQGSYTFACQQLQDPKADEVQGFKRDWLKFYQKRSSSGMNVYILVDPANEKKKRSDYTAMAVIGTAADGNYYLLDLVRDRLNLSQRTETLFDLHKIWNPNAVGYEKYGKDSDIEHIEYVQEDENYRFDITPLGGILSKVDRIRRLIPIFESGRFYLPSTLVKTTSEGKAFDIIEDFLTNEYDAFPVGAHDDMLDALARICDEDMFVTWPKALPERYSRSQRKKPSSWMAR